MCPGWLQTNAVAGNAYNLAQYYTPIVWNPDDSRVTLAGVNDSSTRTFRARAATGGVDNRLGDGLMISGRVSLTYVAVPEPSTFLLLAPGLSGLLVTMLRRRRTMA